MLLSSPELQIVIPGQMLDLGNGASPGNQEDLMPPSDRIFNKRITRPEIEQIVLVDARRHDQERCFLDLRRLRRILDELNQLVLKDNRSGRYCQIASHLKSGFVDPGDAPFLEIFNQVLHPGRQARRTRLDCCSNDFRVSRREIRRAHRINELTRVEAKLQL